MRARRKSQVQRVVVAVIATVISAVQLLGPASAAPAASGGPSGSATAENTLASLAYGTAITKAGVDRAVSAWGASPSAEAALDFLTAGTTTLGGGSWTATTEAESGSDALGTGTKTIDGLASATITDASVEAVIESNRASSSTVMTIADLSLLDGLVTAAAAQTSTTSTVGTTEARVERTLSLGDVKVLSIRKLLERLGVDPASLTCAGVETAGAELGVDTSQTCETLAGVQGAVAAIQAELADRSAMLTADLQTMQATLAGLTIVTQPLVDLAAGYGIDLSGLVGLLLSGSSRDALLAEIEARLAAVDGGIGEAAAGTCETVQAAVAGVTGTVPSLAGILSPMAATLSDACAVLRSLLDDLLDVSLLGLDSLTIGLNALAEPDVPLAEGIGTIGAVTVGNRSIALAGITSVGETLQSAIASAKTEVSDALTALGIGAFPEPEIEILGIESSAGRDQANTWYASVTVTGLHVAIPPVPISLPSGATLGSVLDAPAASAPGPAPASAAESAAAPVAESPQIIVDAAVFTGDARYNAAGPINPNPLPDPDPDPDPGPDLDLDPDPGDTPLPTTGVASLWLAALLLLVIAGAIARTIARVR